MSVTATVLHTLTVVEELETGVPAASAANSRITHNEYNLGVTLNSGSTPPATKVAAFEIQLGTGTATIDLEALSGTNGATVVGTALRVQVAKFRAHADNTAFVSIAEGAANGYDGFGAGFKISLEAGFEAQFYLGDAGADIGAANSDLDLASTDQDAIMECELVLG